MFKKLNKVTKTKIKNGLEKMLTNTFFEKRHEWLTMEGDMEVSTDKLIAKYPNELNKKGCDYAEFENFIYNVLPNELIDDVLKLTNEEIAVEMARIEG